MPDEILVYKSVIDPAGSISSIEQIRKINAIMKKELEQAGQVGSDGWKKINQTAIETGKTFEQVQSALKAQFIENKAKIDDFNRSLRQTADGAGSINELRQTVITLAREYDSLSKAERDSAKGTELREKLASTTQELKNLEGETGRFQRDVGNYTAKVYDAAKGTMVFGVNVGSVIDPLKKMQSGFKDAGGGASGFFSVFASGGIGIAIAALQMFIKVFQEFGGVADKVEQITEGLSGGFKAFATGGSAIEAGKAIADLTEKIQLLEEAEARAILTNEQTNASIKRLQVAARDRTKSEEDRIGLLQKADDLAYKQWKDNYDRILQTALAEEARFAKKNTLSELEVKTAIFSNDIIKKSYDYLTDAQINATRDKVGAIVKLDGEEVKKLIENRVKLEQASEAYTDIVDKNTVRENKLADDLQAKKEKALADEKARNEKAAKEREAYLANLSKLEDDFYLNERQKLEKTFTDKLAQITGTGQREIALRLTVEQEMQFALEKFDRDSQAKRDQAAELKRQKEKAARDADFVAQNDFLSRQLDLDLKRADLEIGTAEQKEKRKQEIQINSLERQLDLAIQYLGADGDITKAELQGIEAIQLALKAAKQAAATPQQSGATFGSALGVDDASLGKVREGLGVLSNAFSAVSQIVSQSFQQRLSNIDTEKNAEIAKIQASGLEEEQKQARIKQIEKKAAKEKYKLQEEQFKANQAMQIINAIIAGAVGIVSAFQLGPIAGAIAAALIGATTAVQIGIIASQKPPAPPKIAARGIMLDGPSHQSGGIKTMDGQYEFEGGELVANKYAGYNPKSRSIMSHVNRLFGGVSYPGTVPLPNHLKNAIEGYIGQGDSSSIYSTMTKFAAGGFVPAFPRTTTDQIGGNSGMMDELRRLSDAILNQPPPVVAVTDINQGQDRVKVLEASGTNG